MNIKNNALWATILLSSVSVAPVLHASTIATPTEVAQTPHKAVILSGVVVDQEGAPLPQATIKLMGTKKGVITNMKGEFHINIGNPNKATLLITYIGMKPQKVTYKKGGKRLFKVVLAESSKMLSDVVATGMQVIDRDKMTGSASVLTARDLRTQGFTSIDRMLDGMVVGLNSTTINGAPGMRSKISIRGENSLNGNTEPLWIIDGLPMLGGVPLSAREGSVTDRIMQDGIGNIMPEDIESISILKDAAAASIYGARAANGVIVITTKKGFRSKTQISYSGVLTLSQKMNADVGMMNSRQKLDYEKMVVDNYGIIRSTNAGRGGNLYRHLLFGDLTQEQYDQQINQLAHTNTNWMDVIFRHAFSQVHNINLRGGTEELSYYSSLSYTNQEGILQSNRYQNAGILLNLDYRPNKKWIISFQTSINNRKNTMSNTSIDPFNYAVFANPYEKPYNEDGSYAADLSYLPNNYSTEHADGYRVNNFNILREMRETSQNSDATDANLTLSIRFEPIQRLTIQANARIASSKYLNANSVNPGTYASRTMDVLANAVYGRLGLETYPKIYDNGSLTESAGRSNDWTARLQADYTWSPNKNHMLTAFAAFEAYSRNYNSFSMKSPIYYNDYRMTGFPQFVGANPTYADLEPAINGLYNTAIGQSRSLSFIGSLMYNMFQDRYVLTMNARSDGADIMGKGNRYVPLWSMGAKWNLHKETLFRLPSFVKELALRGSFGYTGNIDRNAYPIGVMTLSGVPRFYEGHRIATSLAYPNTSVRWEKKRDIGIALEANLMNRIFFTIEHYNNKTIDLLTNMRLPISTGRENIRANNGATQNIGYEFDLRVKWIDTRDFLFSTNFNIARNKNLILRSEQNYNIDRVRKGSGGFGGQYNFTGHEIGGLYGLKYAGVNPMTGNPRYYLTDAGRFALAKYLDSWDAYPGSEFKRYAYRQDPNHLPEVMDMYPDDKITPVLPFLQQSIQYLGRTNPIYVGGFSTYMRYKGLEFSTNWSYKMGHLVPLFNDYNAAPKSSSGDARFDAVGYVTDLAVSNTNREQKYLTFWKTPGDITNVHRFMTGATDYWAQSTTSDKYASGNYLRMTNVSLSYRFDHKLLKPLHINRLQVSLQGRNLLTLTKYRGFDVGTGRAFTYPVAKEYSMKLTVGF